MRSSNYKHAAKPAANSVRRNARPAKKAKKFSKFGSVVTLLVVITAIVIPSVTLIQNVEAVTNAKKTVFAIGGSDVFADEIAPPVEIEEETLNIEEREEVNEAQEKKPEKKEEEVEETTEPETEEVTEEVTEEEAEYEDEYEDYSDYDVDKSYALVSTTNVDTSYAPSHIELSDYDRDLLERLVMGEGGTMGYSGAALIAQAVRDSMVESGTTSVESIISEYQYDGSTDGEPNSDVKDAVSFIFDEDGCAVQHRILYFYAADMVDAPWHESQEFIVSYGNVRFFDMW